MKMLYFRLAAMAFALLMTALPARAAELVMVEEEWCHWCQKWNDEIGVIYHKTPEGRRAPLRRVDIHGTLPADLTFTKRLNYTPTFVLMHENREIGRIEGYPGEDFFWGLLGRLLDKLPADEQTPAPAIDRPVRAEAPAVPDIPPGSVAALTQGPTR